MGKNLTDEVEGESEFIELKSEHRPLYTFCINFSHFNVDDFGDSLSEKKRERERIIEFRRQSLLSSLRREWRGPRASLGGRREEGECRTLHAWVAGCDSRSL